MAERGHEAGNKERAWSGHLARLIVLIERGDRPAADAELDKVVELAEALRQPAQLQMTLGARATFALFDGRNEAASALIDESVELGERAWMRNLLSARMELWMLRRNQARLSEAKEVIERCLVEFPERDSLCGCVLAHVCAELGEIAEARRLFERFAEDAFTSIPPTSDRIVNLGLLSEVAALLHDVERAAVLYELLLPAADCNALDLPEVFTGAVGRNLGVLAASMGRWAEAEHHFEAALELNERFGALPWVAHTQLGFSRMLLARDEPGDRARSLELLRRSRQGFEQLGMVGWASRSAEAIEGAPAVEPRR